jgi:drug/metabolite transporter (DMT)-like permease
MATDSRARVITRDGPWGFAFLLAYIGAAIYFVSQSDGSFWGVVLGLLKAIVWPGYVVYHVLLQIGA